MRIHYASDLHLEYRRGPLPIRKENVAEGDILVLSGDIFVNRNNLAPLIEELSPVIPIVLVLGNHEYWTHEWDSALDSHRLMIDRFSSSGIHLLEQESRVVNGVRFLGTTLWTDFAGGRHGESCQRGMSDFVKIGRDGGDLLWTDVTARHRESVAWLSSELRKPWNSTTVVVTHHAPSALSNDPRYAGSSISGGFFSNLDDLILETQPDLWIHGHLHFPSDYHIGKTRVLSNPYGYEGYDISPQWDPSRFVEILDPHLAQIVVCEWCIREKKKTTTEALHRTKERGWGQTAYGRWLCPECFDDTEGEK